MATISLPIFLMLLSVVVGEEYVTSVKQNYEGDINQLLVKQIQKELSASYIYQGYASYFQRADVSLPGTRKFFSDASLEEREHAQALIDYINMRGGHAHFGTINLKGSCTAVLDHSREDTNGLEDYDTERLCVCGFIANETINDGCIPKKDWKESLMAFEDALAIERYVNQELLTLHENADKMNDVHLSHILEHEFLEEQISSISKLAQYVTRLRSFAPENYKLGEYMFDQRLS